MKNIVLIGMPGAGKSTTGIVLAKTLSYSFCDTDLVIQEIEGRKLQEIIDNDGFEAFKKAEENAVVETVKRFPKKTVIATGGSVIYSDKSMENLRKNGKIIYLKVGTEELKRRITNIKVRGIAIKPGQSFEDLAEERKKLYEKYADFIIDADKNTIEKNVESIVKLTEKLKVEKA